MKITQIRVNVSLAKNFNKVEEEAIVTLDEDDVVGDIIDVVRGELIESCKQGIAEVNAQPTTMDAFPDSQPAVQIEQRASDAQIKLMKARGYAGDPSILTMKQAWNWLHRNK